MSVTLLRLGESVPEAVRGGVVAVGNFDGVHRGHAALVDVARQLAGAHGKIVPVTFDPHPLKLLAPERYQPPLTTISERAKQLRALGADHVVVLQTSPELLALSPIEFFLEVVCEGLVAHGMVEGFNFRFGRDRAGSNEMLQGLCYHTGMAFREVAALQDGGRPVSSSRVRDALVHGNIADATSLLGRPYRITGLVGTGARRGGTIGFPTANLVDVETIIPATGVYAVRAILPGGEFTGAANIGPNPTFGDDARKIEVHLLDFSGDLYGKMIDVDFIARLRDTKRFESVDALIEQMRHDVAEARRIMAR